MMIKLVYVIRKRDDVPKEKFYKILAGNPLTAGWFFCRSAQGKEAWSEPYGPAGAGRCHRRLLGNWRAV